MAKISRIEIQSFRGVTDSLIIDFRDKEASKPLSMILAGDNGSGKSSIVDAIEFVLQGHIGRKRSKLKKSLAQAVSRLGNKPPLVKVVFSDNTENTREIVQGNNNEWKSTKEVKPEFSISPVVLRRQDVLQFWETPEHEREIIFYDFLKIDSSVELTETQSEKIALKEEERIALKEKRKDKLQQLAICIGKNKDVIPIDPKKFEEFVLYDIYNGRSRRQVVREAKQNGKKVSNKKNTTSINIVAEKAIREIRDYNKKISELQKEMKEIRKEDILTNTPNKLQEAVRNVLINVGQRITEAFLKISPGRSFVDRIELVHGKLTKVSLAAIVYLKNNKKATPLEIFSEANLDLLALLIYLAFAKEASERGQSKFLVLDDVLQSVDASIRLLVTEYILQEFRDWQLIFTVHDKLWQEQLKILCRRLSHNIVEKEIIKWEPSVGPIVINVSRESNILLKESMKSGDIVWISSQAGMLLEKTANYLSISLQSSLTRRKDDRYTLGDLWPGIYKILKRTNLKQVADEVDRWLHLRNILGAHFNEWAQTLSRQEAQDFGEAVLKLYEKVFCESCYKFVEQTGAEARWLCRCKTLDIF